MSHVLSYCLFSEVNSRSSYIQTNGPLALAEFIISSSVFSELTFQSQPSPNLIYYFIFMCVILQSVSFLRTEKITFESTSMPATILYIDTLT